MSKTPPIDVTFVGLTEAWCVYAARKLLEFEVLYEHNLHAGSINQDPVDQLPRQFTPSIEGDGGVAQFAHQTVKDPG